MSRSGKTGMLSLLLGASALGRPIELLVPEQPLYDKPVKKRRTKDQARKKKIRQQRKKSRGY